MALPVIKRNAVSCMKTQAEKTAAFAAVPAGCFGGNIS